MYKEKLQRPVFLVAALLSFFWGSSLFFSSCSAIMGEKASSDGHISICFVEDFATKAVGSIPDTNDFILKVTDSKGAILYNGTYGAAPMSITAEAGSYTVSAISSEFSAPLFDAPQYGDTQVVVVKAGETTNVTLSCAQMNCGIKLNINPSFLSDYPNGVLFLKSSDGKVMYSYTEDRIAYFNPGSISLMLSNGGTDKTLFTRTMKAQQILVINVATSSGNSSAGGSSSGSGIVIKVDTTRNWLAEDYVIGGTNNGSDTESAYSISKAKENIGASGVWVYGYIVGGDLSSSKCSFQAPFVSRTNIVLAAKSSCTDKEACLSVQLSKGDIRDAINLVDHEDLLGKKIYLKGDIVEAYYGIPGLQSITEYKF